jgi:hypothetical protein
MVDALAGCCVSPIPTAPFDDLDPDRPEDEAEDMLPESDTTLETG